MELLGMDAGYMSAEEARHVRAVHGKMPKNFRAPQKEPQTLVLEKNTPQGIRRIGMVFFPESAPDVQEQKIQEQKILAAGEKLMKGVDFVIGISLWGEARDSAFLFLAAGSFDLILSSGHGEMFKLKTRADAPGVALLRPVDRGVAVPGLDLFEWPKRSVQKRTAPALQLNIFALGDSMPEDQAMAALISQSAGMPENPGWPAGNATAEEFYQAPEDDIFSSRPVNTCR